MVREARPGETLARPGETLAGQGAERKQFHAFLVEPQPGFSPDDWRDRPSGYRIVSYEGPLNYRGRADAWRFMQNQLAMQQGLTDRWAICVN